MSKRYKTNSDQKIYIFSRVLNNNTEQTAYIKSVTMSKAKQIADVILPKGGRLKNYGYVLFNELDDVEKDLLDNTKHILFEPEAIY